MLIPEQIYFLSLPEADGSDNGDRNISGTITRTCGGGQRRQNSTSPWTIPPSPPWAAHPLEWFPAQYQQTFRVFTECILIALLWSMQPSKRLGLNHTKQVQNSQKTLFSAALFAQAESIWWLSDVMVTQLITRMSMTPRWVIGANLSEHTHSAPCVGTFLSRHKRKL